MKGGDIVLKRRKIMFASSVLMLLVLWFADSALSKEPELIAQWPLDEKSGNIVQDIIGGNNGKFKGGELKWVPAKFGNGLEFDSANKYVEIPRADKLEFADSMTLMAWVNVKAVTGREEIISYADSYVIRITDNVFKGHIFQGGGWPTANGKTPVKTNKWYFVAMTYDSKDVKVYVDGEFDGSIAAPGKIDYQDLPLCFGYFPADPGQSWWFTGVLDEVEIWNKTMTEDEIMKAYESPPPSSAVSSKGKLAIRWGELKSH
jgi:hypothetical protein